MPLPPGDEFDAIVEARRQWVDRGLDEPLAMAAATSIMRAQQLVLAAVERALQPFDLTFASYEALRLLAFTRHGSLPMGKMGERLMVHPASVTNTIDRLAERSLVVRETDEADRRRTLAVLTDDGRKLVEDATLVLNDTQFGLGALDDAAARDLSHLLRQVRADAADFDPATSPDPWQEPLL